MRARLRTRLLIAIAVGLAVGAGGYALVTPKPGRGAQMVEMFERYCVPFAKDRVVPTLDDLQRVSGPPGEETWADPDSAVTLVIQTGSCSVSDVLMHVAVEEHAFIDDAFADLIRKNFSEWELSDDGLDTWDRLRTWVPPGTSGPPGRGIQILRFSQSGPDATTILRAARAE